MLFKCYNCRNNNYVIKYGQGPMSKLEDFYNYYIEYNLVNLAKFFKWEWKWTNDLIKGENIVKGDGSIVNYADDPYLEVDDCINKLAKSLDKVRLESD